MRLIRKTCLGFFLFYLVPLPAGSAEPAFTSAKVCGNCHVAIYQGWKGSLHANAVSDPVFYSLFLETSRETGGKADALCLSCHAPTVSVTGDLKLADPVSREGVTCDYCHSVEEVTMHKAQRITVTPGKKNWGPLKDVSSTAHESAYAPVFEDSRFCGSCHEYKNPLGAPIFETYSEWEASPQAKEGKACQTCHMPKISGRPIAVGPASSKEVYINSHEAAGGHSIEALKKAVLVKLVEVKRAGDRVRVEVRIENVGSGHKVPTGIPSRRLILRLQATATGQPLFTADRIYRKVLVDAEGKVIEKDSDLFLKAAKVKEDNRLEPRKPRTEYFELLVPEGKPVDIEVQAYYLYQPYLIEQTEMKVDLGKEKVTVPSQ